MGWRLGSRRAFALAEVVVVVAILGALVAGAYHLFSGQVISQSRSVNRWKAQIALESVVNTVASSQESDLIDMINNSTSSFSWVTQWQDPAYLPNINVQISVYDASTGAPITPPISTTTSITTYDIDISASGNFYGYSNQKVAEGLTWKKRLEHM